MAQMNKLNNKPPKTASKPPHQPPFIKMEKSYKKPPMANGKPKC